MNDVDIRQLLDNLESAKNEAVKDCNALTPPPSVLKWSETDQGKKDSLTASGMDAICRGEVAAVIMSGGQGTRLGFKGPKGMYNIGLASGKSIFQLHMERLQKMRMLAAAKIDSPVDNVHIPVYIMTSMTNTQTIQDYFAEKNYFNYPHEDVFFFEQGLLPCLTQDGQMIIESPDALAMAPDGNGGIFPAMKKSGAFQNMMDRNVKHLHVYGIDNVLTKSVDPGFIGYCIENGVEVANKVVPRADASEKVGVTAVREGKMCIVEYSELPPEMTGCDSRGKLIYSAANICNHYFSVNFLVDKVMFASSSLYHLAHKKIPYYNPVTKVTETPSSPNGVKLEMFVFDVFPLADKWAVMECLREDEFAPVKNAPGSATDSPDTARALLSDQAIRWLTSAGAICYKDLSKDKHECEISPLLSYGGEGLEAYNKRKIPLPCVLYNVNVMDLALDTCDISELRRLLHRTNQEHILDFFPDMKKTDTIYKQLHGIDIPALLLNLESAKNEAVKDCNALTPPPSVLKWSETVQDKKDSLTALGMDAMCRGEVAAVIMSGGQGTRLGFKGPKGMYNIGLASGKSIFQLHMERLQKMRMLAAAKIDSPVDNVHIPVYIMTSVTNTQTIQDYFAEKKYFNYPHEDVFFFEQGLLPCLTQNGQMIIESPDALAMAPDGNGGIFPAMKKSGAFQNMMDRNVKHLHIYGIDNVLTKSVDPGFIGYCIENGVEVANKVVPRADASEKVGVTAVREGKMCIVEYSELPPEMTGCDSRGKLIYSAANICNHYCTVKFLRDKVLSGSNSLYHLAHKKIPYYNPVTKVTETPSSPNGVKLEMFVFDVFPLADKWAVMECLREDEFAPVKNAPGSPTDSPDTARALLSNQAIRWLTAIGASTYDGGNDFAEDGSAIRKECEISPLLSYGGEGLDHLCGAKIPLPSCFRSPHELDDEEI